MITDIFQGQLFNKVICDKCEKEHYSFENFLSISLTLNRDIEQYNVSECFRKFTNDELVKDGEGYYCRACKRSVDVTKNVILWRLPPVIIIHLKRFYCSDYRREKLDGLAEFEAENFDLEEFCGGSSNL